MKKMHYLLISFLILTGWSSINCTEKNKTMDTHSANIQLIGEELTISYLADPMISYGVFELTNDDSQAITASISSLKLLIGDFHQQITEFHIFDLNQEVSLESNEVSLEAQSKFRFNLGFPRIPYTQPLADPIELVLEMKINDQKLEAVCRIKMEKRIPRHQ